MNIFASTTISRSTTSLVIRSLLFSVGMILATLAWAPVVIAMFPLAFDLRYRIAQQWSRFNIWWLEKTCGIDCHISGREHIPNTPVVVIAKHQSAWETIFLQQFLPPVAWVVKRELLWVPFFGWALALLNPISIKREAARSAVKDLLRQGKDHLNRGQSVLIFPEGTRTTLGSRIRYNVGGAMLAAHSGRPILPIAHNAGQYWPRRGFLKRPGTIQIVFGPLIESSQRNPRELNTLVENWIEATMQRISETPLSQVGA